MSGNVVAAGPITRYGAIAAVTLTARGKQYLDRCLLDIGSNRTYVLKSELARIGAQPTGRIDVAGTLTTPANFAEYLVALRIGSEQFPALRVLEAEAIPDRMRAVVGRDIINRFRFDYGGMETWRWELRRPEPLPV